MNLSFRPISTVLLLAFAGTFAQAQPAAATASQPQLDLQRATLQAGRQKISVQLARTPHPLPQLRFRRKPSSLFEYVFEDIEIIGYQADAPIPAPVAV